ncbi:hypothetical protein DFJ43DRAFT_465050 [Lentinula guzmanii]|uniref:Uncharacterized protein n=1 Tax=Lentinula guzmanii TaxID=2804957 RepID=A0AA38JFN9_9AGAR|nr:hypothetical protein DFJ43DRAFT_465050 [Lentinula guzmanii]
MADTSALAQHSPAVKVGGRRLSINSKPHTHRPLHPTSEESDEKNSSAVIDSDEPSARTNAAEPSSVPFDDYPRPIHHSENTESQENQEHKERVPHSRKDQKHGHGFSVGEWRIISRRGKRRCPRGSIMEVEIRPGPEAGLSSQQGRACNGSNIGSSQAEERNAQSILL